jgi:hypothetical protein
MSHQCPAAPVLYIHVIFFLLNINCPSIKLFIKDKFVQMKPVCGEKEAMNGDEAEGKVEDSG